GISPLYKTGQPMPALKLIDIREGEALPHEKSLTKGDRFVTLEKVSDYGYLYNYDSVVKIAGDLKCCCSDWRIPSKDDWDDTLNGVEPNVCDRNHGNVQGGVYLGRYAGKLLKSKRFWMSEDRQCCCGEEDVPTTIDYNESPSTNKCDTIVSGVDYKFVDTTPPYPQVENFRGTDAFGFGVTPAGYSCDNKRTAYFK
ncbi:MAG: hypothetical protein EZS28_055613, partial [Streblomastix strix]